MQGLGVANVNVTPAEYGQSFTRSGIWDWLNGLEEAEREHRVKESPSDGGAADRDT